LELGCGTGFFLLNLMQAGLTARGSVTDLSPGMVAAALRNAENLGLDVEGRVADAEQIPYDDATFDVVVGHAVLHHIPNLDAAFREVLRVLKPGGRFVFAGEPTRIGDRYARLLGGLTWKATTALTRLPALRGWRRPQTELDESSRAAVPADKLGFGWAMFAYRSWLRLSWLDEHVLARVVPRAWFYNALVTGTRPA